MKTKLKLLIAAAMVAVGGAAIAAPQMQNCAPMEVLHNGSAELGYELKCSLGEWSISYAGSVPAGTEAVNVQYKLTAKSNKGPTFSQLRSTRLQSTAHLGQALLREAVLLDSGELALRECKEINCSMYRALGQGGVLAKATTTVSPVEQRMLAEQQKLQTELMDSQIALGAQRDKVKSLELELNQAKDQLGKRDTEIQTVKNELATTVSNYAAAQVEQSKVVSVSAESHEGDRVKALEKELGEALNAVAKLTEFAEERRKDIVLLSETLKDTTDKSLEILSQYEKLERETKKLREELTLARNERDLAETKTKAAHLARDLSMQAADVAHMDANGLNHKIKDLSYQVEQRDKKITDLLGKAQTTATTDGATVSDIDAKDVRQMAAKNVDKRSETASDGQKVKALHQEAVKLKDQLNDVLPELYALRHINQKLERERDQARAQVLDLQILLLNKEQKKRN